jgi:hypothetical protein
METDVGPAKRKVHLDTVIGHARCIQISLQSLECRLFLDTQGEVVQSNPVRIEPVAAGRFRIARQQPDDGPVGVYQHVSGALYYDCKPESLRIELP